MDLKILFKDKKFIFFLIIISLIIVVNIFRLYITYQKYFDEDELRQVHVGWLIKEDGSLYKDILYEHTPLPIYFITLVLKITGETVNVLITLRILFYIIAILFLFFLYKTTKKMYDSTTALLTVLFFSFNIHFLDRGVEIRPETWANLIFWIGLFFLIDALKDKNSNLKYMISGFLFGIGILFTQKILFILFPIFILLIYNLIKDKKYIKKIFYFILPLLAPVMLFLISLIKKVNFDGILVLWKFSVVTARTEGAMVLYNLIKNTQFNILIWIAAIVASFFVIYDIAKKKKISENLFDMLVLAEFLMFIIFINVASSNAAYGHSYLPFLPFVSILAAMLMVKLKNNLGNNYAIVLLLIIGILIPTLFAFPILTKSNNKTQIEIISNLLNLIDKEDRVYGGNGIVLFRRDTEPYFWYYPILMKSRIDPTFKASKENIYLNETRLIILDDEIKKTNVTEFIDKAYIKVSPLSYFITDVSSKGYGKIIINAYIPGRIVQIDRAKEVNFYIEYSDYYQAGLLNGENIKNIFIDNQEITNNRILLNKGYHTLHTNVEEIIKPIVFVIFYSPEKN